MRNRRHALTDESEHLVNTVRLWTYPRDITCSDHICHACWELANHQSFLGNTTTRQIGHLHVCIVCGLSITRISSRRVLIHGANEQQQRITDIISSWIQPQQLSSVSEACVPCWLRAQRASKRNEAPQPDHEDILNIRCCLCGNIVTSAIRPQPPSMERQILEVISRLLENHQLPSIYEVCVTCYERVQQELPEPELAAEMEPDPAAEMEPEPGAEMEPGPGAEMEPGPAAEMEPEPGAEMEPGPAAEIYENVIIEPQMISSPNIRRAAETPRHCIFRGCAGLERRIVPEETRRRVLLHFHYFIPRGARICSNHLENEQYDILFAAEFSLDTFSRSYIEEIIFLLMEGLENVSYENIQNYPEHQVQYFIGLTKQQHQQILNETPSLRQMVRGSFALTALLCKLRTGDSGDRLSCLFQVPRRTLETLMSIARKHLLREYVPQHLGFAHLTREQEAEKNSYIADGIYGEPDAPSEQKPAIVIADATYLYTQKSSNYLFQNTYSLHKYRNFVKPFVMCCCYGYILDVRGPYTATTNVTIMREILNDEEFNNFFRENDIFILDRGFRDCMDSLHDKGYLGYMPETRGDDQSQLTTLEANRSRCITINRWVVEAVNGRFKRDFKIFRHEYFNRACPHIMDDFKIAASLLKAFSTHFVDSINAEQFVNIINNRMFLTNYISNLVAEQNLNRRGALFIPIDGTNMCFPRLSMQDLILFACGIYQIRQARSYVGEHFRYHGIYTLEVCRDEIRDWLEGVNPVLVRAKIKSRHRSRKTYFVFIVYERNSDGLAAILSYCCNCIVGLRTVGCCSHMMSILWYLGYARHEGLSRPAPFLDDVLLRTIE